LLFSYFSYSSFLHPFASSFVSQFGSFISPHYAVAENKYNKKKVNKRNEKTAKPTNQHNI